MEPCPRNPRYEHFVFTSITLLWDFEFLPLESNFEFGKQFRYFHKWKKCCWVRERGGGGGGRAQYNNSAGWGIWQSVCSPFRDMEATPFKWRPRNYLWLNPTGCKNWTLSRSVRTMNSMSSVLALWLPSNYLSRSTREVTSWCYFHRLPGTPPPSRYSNRPGLLFSGVLCLWMVPLVLFLFFPDNLNTKACNPTPCLAVFLDRIILISWATNYCNCTAVCFMFLGACVG